jgi:hypothetical protein
MRRLTTLKPPPHIQLMRISPQSQPLLPATAWAPTRAGIPRAGGPAQTRPDKKTAAPLRDDEKPGRAAANSTEIKTGARQI